MKRDDVYDRWAPENDPWSAWVKPVLFANLDEEVTPQPLSPTPDWVHRTVVEPLAVERASTNPLTHPYRGDLRPRDTAVVIDLPGEIGTRIGVALTDFAFRPIPLYNAVPSIIAVVELAPIMAVLVDAAERVGRSLPARHPRSCSMRTERVEDSTSGPACSTIARSVVSLTFPQQRRSGTREFGARC